VDINFSIAFIFGFLSFFSPCVLPLVPGYLAMFSLQRNNSYEKLIGSIQFVLGFSVVFISLAAITTSIGSFFTKNASLLSKVSGVIIIIFGLILLIPKLNSKYFFSSNFINIDNFKKTKNFIMGFTFGFGFTPCIGPVLGALLTLSSNAETAQSGIFYLVFFSLGLGIPFITISVIANKVNFKNRIFIEIQKISSKLSGVTLLVIGTLIYMDKMYLLASFFQNLLIFLNLEWLSTI